MCSFAKGVNGVFFEYAYYIEITMTVEVTRWLSIFTRRCRVRPPDVSASKSSERVIFNCRFRSPSGFVMWNMGVPVAVSSNFCGVVERADRFFRLRFTFSRTAWSNASANNARICHGRVDIFRTFVFSFGRLVIVRG